MYRIGSVPNLEAHLPSDRPPEPPAVEYGAVIDGLANLRRTFELPGRMRLNDLIELYIDIWEAGD